MSYISPLEPELNEGDRCVLVFMTSAVLLYAARCTLYAVRCTLYAVRNIEMHTIDNCFVALWLMKNPRCRMVFTRTRKGLLLFDDRCWP
jgi:hypothetical protein